MQLEFKTKNDKQLIACNGWLDEKKEQILYGGAKGGGKSFLGASLIFADALIYPDTAYFIARKELNDLRKFTMPTIRKVFENWGLKIDDYTKFNGQDNTYTLDNGSRVLLIACKDEPSDPLFERFGSMEMTRGWIEEGGEVAEKAYTNLWMSIGRQNNIKYNLKKKLLITANPKKGWMKREFVDPHKEGTLPDNKMYIQAFATDNPYLATDYLETLKGNKDVIQRQRLWEGNWDYDETKDSLITHDALTDAFSNTIVKDGHKYTIVDVARLGKDSTIVGIWDGLELVAIHRYVKQATNVTVEKVKDLNSAERVPFSNTLIDDDGIGGGVVDNLFGVKSFNNNGSPIPTATEIRERLNKKEYETAQKTTFANLKSQCGWKLAELINEHNIKFSVPEYRDIIIEELTALLRQKDVDNDGKKQLKPKDEVKEELGKSPDVGDMIIMRIWFELQKIAKSVSEEKKSVTITRPTYTSYNRR